MMSDAYYLSDGGYSRLMFLEEGDVRLSSVSREAVARKWNDPAVDDARRAVELSWKAWLGAYQGPDA